MTDPRFTTAPDQLAALLDGADLDEVGDIETLLMVLLDRPMSVEPAWDDETEAEALDVRIHGNEFVAGFAHDFPLSLVGLARSCAEVAEDLGPYTAGTTGGGVRHDVLAMSDGELVAALRDALGMVRLSNLLDDE